MRRLTTEEFIEKAENVHKKQYSYEGTVYINAKTIIKVTCQKHGDFNVTPTNHLRGDKCPICRNEKLSEERRKGSDDFIEEANKKHGNKYDYSKVGYINNRTKVCIICPKHGEFWQTPDKHLRGCGCPKCSGKMKKTKNDFIKEANEKHKNKYDYSKVEYRNNKEKVIIICPIHGEFLQTPHCHLSGCGCPYCNESKLEREVDVILKDIGLKYQRQYRYDKEYPRMSLDFYLTDLNIGIECQGEQHFKPTVFKSGLTEEEIEKEFKKTIKRDELKRKRCKELGITLWYVVDKKRITPITDIILN